MCLCIVDVGLTLVLILPFTLAQIKGLNDFTVCNKARPTHIYGWYEQKLSKLEWTGRSTRAMFVKGRKVVSHVYSPNQYMYIRSS